MSKTPAVQKRKNRILKKNVSAIHISAELSLVQRKLVNALLFNAYENLPNNVEHEINVPLLMEMISTSSSKNVSHLKDAIRGLVETSVQFDVFDNEGYLSSEITNLLSYARIYKGTCSYRYDKSLAEKLYHPDIYSKINLSIIRDIKSVNALILYENCHRYINTGETPWWNLDKFRKLMGVDGKSSYEEFKTLNRDVIKPAIVEVNRITNIHIKMEKDKGGGRSISRIKFKVKRNPQLTLLDIEEDSEISNLRAFKRLLDKGISPIGAKHWILENGEEYVTEKLDYVDKIEGAGRIKSTASGLLRKAIEEDYKSEEAVNKKRVKEQDAKREKAMSRENELQALKDQLRAVEKSYRIDCVALIDQEFSNMGEDEQSEALEAFRSTLSGTTRQIFAREKWGCAAVAPQVREFWVKTYSLPLPDINQLARENGIDDFEAHRARVKELEEI